MLAALNSNPPNGNFPATVAVTAPAAVGITLYTTNGNATTGSPQNIYNSLYSNSPLDFTANMTRMRWVLTNNNPYRPAPVARSTSP